MKVFGRKSTATRDGEGGALVQLNNPGLKICNSDRTKYKGKKGGWPKNTTN